MEVFPENEDERIFTVIVIGFAVLTFSSFLSSITSGMTRLRMLQSARATQDFLLRSFLHEKKVSHDLSVRITRHVALAIENNRRSTPVEKIELLGFLTSPLQKELQKELFSPWLSQHPFFCEYMTLDSDAVRGLCSAVISQQTLASDDVIFRHGTVATRMYFVVSGLLRYRQLGQSMTSTASGNEFITLQHGGWLSEAVLWLPWVHKGTATTALHSEVAALSAEAFSQVTVRYPDAFELAKQRAYLFLDLLITSDEASDVMTSPHDLSQEELVSVQGSEIQVAESQQLAEDEVGQRVVVKSQQLATASAPVASARVGRPDKFAGLVDE